MQFSSAFMKKSTRFHKNESVTQENCLGNLFFQIIRAFETVQVFWFEWPHFFNFLRFLLTFSFSSICLLKIDKVQFLASQLFSETPRSHLGPFVQLLISSTYTLSQDDSFNSANSLAANILLSVKSSSAINNPQFKVYLLSCFKVFGSYGI